MLPVLRRCMPCVPSRLCCRGGRAARTLRLPSPFVERNLPAGAGGATNRAALLPRAGSTHRRGQPAASAHTSARHGAIGCSDRRDDALGQQSVNKDYFTDYFSRSQLTLRSPCSMHAAHSRCPAAFGWRRSGISSRRMDGALLSRADLGGRKTAEQSTNATRPGKARASAPDLSPGMGAPPSGVYTA
eukprot:scaffold19455_cov129-Isochrysis_galbana.AAC.4